MYIYNITYFHSCLLLKKIATKSNNTIWKMSRQCKRLLSKHLEDIPGSTNITLCVMCKSHYMEAKQHVTSKQYVPKRKRSIEFEKNKKI